MKEEGKGRWQGDYSQMTSKIITGMAVQASRQAITLITKEHKPYNSVVLCSALPLLSVISDPYHVCGMAVPEPIYTALSHCSTIILNVKMSKAYRVCGMAAKAHIYCFVTL